MIELRHLRYFTAVAEEMSFRRAAERVHIDPTPLSRTVRDLEERLGVSLFVRTPRRLLLTPAGTRLLKEARAVLVRMHRLELVLRSTDACFHSPLRIGVADGIAQPRLSECFAAWSQRTPAIPLELVDLRATELAAALRREELDAGFTFGLPDDEAIAQEPAWDYRVQALLPAAHPLARLPAVPMTDLLTFALVSCDADRQPGLWQQMRSIVQRYTLRPTLAGEAHTLTGYVTRIAAGLGVGLADSGHIETLGRADIAVVPLVQSEHIVTYVTYKQRRRGLPDTLQRFIAHAKTWHAEGDRVRD
ncbi:LysR family transcriptional regulator [Variovorax sp. ZT4R33]|uniref:LysR family transcriptional regulator n=1 Tax=Variovorax sp. ZT4R33 TaxID=3443743 RepID=UPI003F470261